MKKCLSLIICVILLLNCFSFTTLAAAESAQISFSSVQGIISALEGNLLNKTIAERYTFYSLLRSYFETDLGIDSLINVVIDPVNSVPQNLQPIADFINQYSQYKNEMIFALAFIKSIDSADRKTALANFTSKIEYAGLSTKENDALNSLYNTYVSENARLMLQNDHQITAKVLLSLFSCIKGSFKITDDLKDNSDLALDSVSSSFASRLSSNLSPYFSTINGKSTSSIKDVLSAIIKTVNDSMITSQRKNTKIVFGSLSMYSGYTPPTGTKGGGTGGNATTPTPTATPTPTPTPTVTPIPTTEPSAQPTTEPTTDPNATPAPTVKPVEIPAPPVTEKIEEVVQKLPDISDHWSKPYVAELVDRNVFKGYPQGGFEPNKSITREEIAVALVRALGLEDKLDTVSDVKFNDDSSIQDWSKKSIALLTELKIFSGYDDGTFKPDNIITREELAVVIARSLTNVPDANIKTQFNDETSIQNWAKDGIDKAFALGIIKGYDDNTFKGSESITRAEAATMIYNFMYAEKLL